MQTFLSRRPSRRQFLISTAGAIGAGVVPGSLWGRATGRFGMAESVHVFSLDRAGRQRPLGALLPDPPSTALFRRLALVAIDAAKQAGADLADIRIGVQRECGGASAHLRLGYGVRAYVGGATGFQHGNTLTTDAVAGAARTAVAAARTAATLNARRGRPPIPPPAPVPVVQGEWRTPITIDPFSVPLDDHLRLTQLLQEPVRRFAFVQMVGDFHWTVDTRIFASTEGSLVTQELTRGGPTIQVMATLPENYSDSVPLDAWGLGEQSVGFEVALETDFTERVVATAERAIRLRELPLRLFEDVGRFPVVFDGSSMAAVLGATAVAALDADRVTGLEADAAGRSFLRLGAESGGTESPDFSPLLSMTAGRSMPSSVAVQWDDDGVETAPFPVVDRGVVVDFLTSRATAGRFMEWYRRHGEAARVHAGSIAPTPTIMPMGGSAEIHVAPGRASLVLDDLTHGMTHGFLAIGQPYVDASPGLTAATAWPQVFVEVRNGKPVSRIPNIRLSLATSAIAKSALTAIGDARTVGVSATIARKGIPWQEMQSPVFAPAAHCKDVDIVRTDLGV